MKFCPECGTPIKENAKFCTECGMNLINMSGKTDSNRNTNQPSRTTIVTPMGVKQLKPCPKCGALMGDLCDIGSFFDSFSEKNSEYYFRVQFNFYLRSNVDNVALICPECGYKVIFKNKVNNLNFEWEDLGRPCVLCHNKVYPRDDGEYKCDKCGFTIPIYRGYDFKTEKNICLESTGWDLKNNIQEMY